jgi:hypothetical protein
MLGTPPAVWRDIPDWEGFYQVSSDGQVRSLGRWVFSKRGVRIRRKGKVLAQSTNPQGYKIVVLSRRGKQYGYGVHRLVCIAFHGPPPSDKHETAHWDGSKDNNVPDNLRWATGTENQLDRHRHHAAFITNNKITASTAAEVKARLQAGQMQKVIASDLGITKAIVGHIARGNAWTHVTAGD